MMRPTVRTVRKYRWLNKHGEAVEGVALMGDRGILAHLTHQEAFAVATQLADHLEAHRNQDTKP